MFLVAAVLFFAWIAGNYFEKLASWKVSTKLTLEILLPVRPKSRCKPCKSPGGTDLCLLALAIVVKYIRVTLRLSLAIERKGEDCLALGYCRWVTRERLLMHLIQSGNILTCGQRHLRCTKFLRKNFYPV